MLTFMTYNMYSGRTPSGGYDLEGKIETARRVGPDILGLNEVHRGTAHSGGLSQADVIADALGMKYRFFARAIYHDGGEYGIALLSRIPFLKARVVPIPDADVPGLEPRVCIDAVADTPTGKLRVIISHYGLSREEEKNAVDTTLKLAGDDMPAVFMGDLNATPDSEELAPLFKRFADTAADEQAEKMLTFPSDTPNRRIDYIFADRGIRTIRTGVIDSKASDHRPVFACLEAK